MDRPSPFDEQTPSAGTQKRNHFSDLRIRVSWKYTLLKTFRQKQNGSVQVIPIQKKIIHSGRIRF